MMKRFALIGHNIGYSKSPQLHTAGFRELEIDAEFDLLDMPLEAFHDWCETAAKTYDGFAVTKPYKQEIRKYLSRENETVRAVGACNTVTVIDGQLHGTNTDALGLAKSFVPLGDMTGKNVLLMGAGGAARSAVHAFTLMGVKAISIWNRTPERITELQKQFPDAPIVPITDISAIPPKQIDIIVNATPMGLKGEGNALPDGFAQNHHIAMDMVYDPLETPFLRAVALAGGEIITGDQMLVHQALAQFKLWHDADLVPEVMFEAFFDDLPYLTK